MALSQILPPRNATAVQRAILEAVDREFPVPFSETLDPYSAPAEWLKWLAQHESVRLWFDDWPEERKRRMIAEAPVLAGLVGTRAAAERFLAFVDAEIIHKVSYPAQRSIGQWALGIHPIAHPPFKARLLVKVALKSPRGAFIIGRSALGFGALLPPSDEPIRRARLALSLSKAPDTLVAVSFAHRRRQTLDDGFNLDAGHVLGSFTDRSRL